MFEADIYWEGQSGKEYGFWIHRVGSSFFNKPGNYIYAKKVGDNEWLALYIGQTENLEECGADNEQHQCARRNGATHVHIHTTPRGEAARTDEQRDLIAKWSPPCNL
ncbi:MAG: hypothetical protein HY646_17695 [Acidobacteria bacterium]|nr:hypothetical protein [Acidobacteriota bacterium]